MAAFSESPHILPSEKIRSLNIEISSLNEVIRRLEEEKNLKTSTWQATAKPLIDASTERISNFETQLNSLPPGDSRISELEAKMDKEKEKLADFRSQQVNIRRNIDKQIIQIRYEINTLQTRIMIYSNRARSNDLDDDDLEFMTEVSHSILPKLLDKLNSGKKKLHDSDIDIVDYRIIEDEQVSVDALVVTPHGKKYLWDQHPVFYRDYVDSLTGAIRTLHDNGIVHRDIRPDNIIFEKLPDGSHPPYRAVLIDLGFCCKIDTQPRAYSGTLRYASDNVLRAYAADSTRVTVNKEDDRRSLIYCVIAFQCPVFQKTLCQLKPKGKKLEAFISKRKRLFDSFATLPTLLRELK